jgi:hypothetical protein
MEQAHPTTTKRPLNVIATVICAEGQRHRDLIVCRSSQEAQRIVDAAFPGHRYCSLMCCVREAQ